MVTAERKGAIGHSWSDAQTPYAMGWDLGRYVSWFVKPNAGHQAPPLAIARMRLSGTGRLVGWWRATLSILLIS